MDKIGKYTVSSEIGRGGMGIVYRALDPYIGRTVAVKTVRLDLLRQETGKDEALKRFLREAQAAGNLSHPNIVTIYEVGEHEGLIYIAMEHIEGASLEAMLQQGRKFSLEEIVRLVAQVSAALDYAHGKGIVHRDIKPANILVGGDLKVSIVDFGIARTAASTMTQTGMLMGTPRYMSPEQISGKKVDSRADIFSLGAILYELLTQRNPFEGESITTVIYKIMHAELPPLSDYDRQLPAALDAVVRKALARDADARYATCAELLAGLRGCLPSASPGDAGSEGRAGLEQTQLLRNGERTVLQAPAARSRRWLPAMAALVLFVLAAVVAVRHFSRRPAPVPPPSAATLEEAPTGNAAGETAQEEAPTLATDSTAPVAPAVVPEERPASPPGSAAAKTKPVGEDAAAEPLPVREQEPPPVPVKSQPPPNAARNSRGFLEAVFFNGTAMVQIPAGEFTIGSPPGQGDDDEHPAHRVFISAYWLGKSEVTFAQFDAFCAESNRPLPKDEGWGRGSRPVIHVSWDDADAYCRWLSQKSGRRFRLPSEAEWEKAARERYPWGRKTPDRTLVNMKGRDDGYEFTAPVGAFPPGASSFGILDMAGNVWEWTSDWYDAGYYASSPGRDPRGPAGGESRSVRGGSWANGPELIRSANRSSERPGNRLNVLGFRVAMDD